MIAIVPSNLPVVGEFYKTYSTDNAWTGDILVPPTMVDTSPVASFEDLLKVIAKYQAQNENQFLIASHGDEFGLFLPVVRGSKVESNAEGLLDQLREYADGDTDGRDDLLNGEWEDSKGKKARAFKDVKELDRLAALVKKVRQVGMDQVHFRACNIGGGPGLKALHRLLGSKHTEAPTSWFVFFWRTTANLPAKGELKDFGTRVDRMASPRRVYTRDECKLPFDASRSGDDPALALSVVTGYDGKPNIAAIEAVSQEAVAGWTQTFLEDSQFYPFGRKPPGGGYRLGQKLVVFGIANTGDPTNPVLFPGDDFSFLKLLAVEN
jgi:hypothetical protein